MEPLELFSRSLGAYLNFRSHLYSTCREQYRRRPPLPARVCLEASYKDVVEIIGESPGWEPLLLKFVRRLNLALLENIIALLPPGLELEPDGVVTEMILHTQDLFPTGEPAALKVSSAGSIHWILSGLHTFNEMTFFRRPRLMTAHVQLLFSQDIETPGVTLLWFWRTWAAKRHILRVGKMLLHLECSASFRRDPSIEGKLSFEVLPPHVFFNISRRQRVPAGDLY